MKMKAEYFIKYVIDKFKKMNWIAKWITILAIYSLVTLWEKVYGNPILYLSFSLVTVLFYWLCYRAAMYIKDTVAVKDSSPDEYKRRKKNIIFAVIMIIAGFLSCFSSDKDYYDDDLDF